MGEGGGDEGEEGGRCGGGEVHDEDVRTGEVRSKGDGIDLLVCSRFVRWTWYFIHDSNPHCQQRILHVSSYALLSP